MQTSEDMEGLAEYVRSDSATAFSQVVARHIDFVYSMALRRVNNPPEAEEITKATFLILARKARRLRPETILPLWLFRITRSTAANFLRNESSRVHRELDVYVQSLSYDPAEETWKQISPWLDDALAHLAEKERNVALLHFVLGKSLSEAKTILGWTEEITVARASRSLEKLRGFLARRGVALSGETLATNLATQAVRTTPSGVDAVIKKIVARQSTKRDIPTFVLVRRTLRMMLWEKIRIPVITSTALMLTALLAFTVIATRRYNRKNYNYEELRRAMATELLKKTQRKYSIMSSYRGTGKVVSEINGQTLTTTFELRLGKPNLYRVEWEQTSSANTTHRGVVWSTGAGDFLLVDDSQFERIRNRETALAVATRISSGAAATIPGTFFNSGWGNTFKPTHLADANLEQQKNEMLRGQECYVFSRSLTRNGMTADRTIWIGKQDFLIHQVRQAFHGTVAWPTINDAAIIRELKRENKPTTPEAIIDWRRQWQAKMNEAMQKLQGQTTTFLETHENLEINPPMKTTDFDHQVPAGIPLNEPVP